jgi:hypothetical protein
MNVDAVRDGARVALFCDSAAACSIAGGHRSAQAGVLGCENTTCGHQGRNPSNGSNPLNYAPARHVDRTSSAAHQRVHTSCSVTMMSMPRSVQSCTTSAVGAPSGPRPDARTAAALTSNARCDVITGTSLTQHNEH